MKNIITSVKNPLIKELAAIISKSKRLNMGLMLLEGEKLINEALKSNKLFKYIFIDIYQSDKYKNLIANFDENIIFYVNDIIINKLSSEISPQGILAYISIDGIINSSDDITCGRYIALERIQDPGNIGTIIRTAEAFGMDGVIIDDNCCDVLSVKVLRSSMGSVLREKIYLSKDFIKTIKELEKKDFQICATLLDENAVSVTNFKFDKNLIVFIGNEGEGISLDLKKECKNKLYIPMCGNVQSLNAAIASAVIIWEINKTI